MACSVWPSWDSSSPSRSLITPTPFSPISRYVLPAWCAWAIPSPVAVSSGSAEPAMMAVRSSRLSAGHRIRRVRRSRWARLLYPFRARITHSFNPQQFTENCCYACPCMNRLVQGPRDGDIWHYLRDSEGSLMPGKRPMTEEDLRVLYDLAIYNCTHFGPYTAIVYEDPQRTREYTNIEIAREATQVAAGLRALGIESGDRVMVMMPNCPEVIISYQAIARVGAVAIPVMPLLKGPEVHYIAHNSGAKAIITSPLLLPMLRG